MNDKVFINSICGRCVHVDVCSSIKDNRQKCGSYLEQRPHGEWLYEGAMAEGHPHCAFNCSVCDAHICRIPSDLPNFCEFCGSDNRPKEGAGNERI